jgi:hypothetical protein
VGARPQTRFHKERHDAYTRYHRVLLRLINFHDELLSLDWSSPNPRILDRIHEIGEARPPAYEELDAAYSEVLLVGTHRVRDSATQARTAIKKIEYDYWDDQHMSRWRAVLNNARNAAGAMLVSARDELGIEPPRGHKREALPNQCAPADQKALLSGR